MNIIQYFLGYGEMIANSNYKIYGIIIMVSALYGLLNILFKIINWVNSLNTSKKSEASDLP